MKILPTIGPETIKSKNLKYILNKTEIVRINSSHNTIAWHKSAIRKIKKIKPNSVILIDFPGVKPRTKNITPLKIKKNQIITFKYGNNSKANEILLTKPLPKKIKSKKFSLDDGKYLFKLISKNKKTIKGKSLQDCIIKPKKD